VAPFLGVYLTDLTFIEDGNGDFVPDPNNPDKRLINFDKRRKISRSIAEIKLYQQEPYPFYDIVEIQNFLCGVRGLDERVLLKRSLERTKPGALRKSSDAATNRSESACSRGLFGHTRSGAARRIVKASCVVH